MVARTRLQVVASGLALVLLAGCAEQTAQGTIVGAGSGAIIGAAAGKGPGALLGAVSQPRRSGGEPRSPR